MFVPFFFFVGQCNLNYHQILYENMSFIRLLIFCKIVIKKLILHYIESIISEIIQASFWKNKTCFKLGSILLKLLPSYPGPHKIEDRKNSFNTTATNETWMQHSHVFSKSIWKFCVYCSSSSALIQTSQMYGCCAIYQWGKNIHIGY